MKSSRFRFLSIAVLLFACFAAPSFTQENTGPHDPIPLTSGDIYHINLPTHLTSGRHVTSVRFTHRFTQTLRGGDENSLWGLDSSAHVGFGFDYGFTRFFQAGIYRSNFFDDWELSAKYVLWHQTRKLPFSLAFRGGVNWLSEPIVKDDNGVFFQTILSTRIWDRLDFYLVPTYVSNTPRFHNVFAFPAGVSLELTPTLLFLVEATPKNKDLAKSRTAWSFGLEKAKGGHRFTLIIANSMSTTVDQYSASDFAIPFEKNDYRFGFNLSRKMGGGTQ